ncbi:MULTISPECIES: glycosyltransferase family 2 protein [unclassified Spirosoma]|uniref:glycosyltransferase family 2 protein n=1 Tax=unclassified Spirosoma TaxID=2621999 RepID=UPI000960E3C6|nr:MULTISPECIES: glycosyltransferase family 2 protein [unclassified Spirosoma]MBN8820658.1 glycosyltransferase family 2 protein [Spirosoma sp.]OJW78033.1 MAG: glycosyltransferase [Spirosoma sp. 48-14]
MNPPPYLSIVVCVYNEAGNCQPLVRQLQQSLSAFDYELIYVNDGSTDQTLLELRALVHDRLRILDLQKNYGQSAALQAGIDAARGEYIVTMDGDLQNDPTDIPQMLTLAIEGDYDLVAGIRAHRQDNALLRKWPSRLANGLIARTTGIRWTDYGCTLKIFRADLAKRLKIYGELHRFIPILAYLEGARMIQAPVRHHARQAGKSKYGMNRTLKVISDLMLMLFLKKYLQKPMHLFGGWGILSSLSGIGLLTYWLTQTVFSHRDISNSPLVIGIVCVLAGLQFIGFGIMSELQMRTYHESQQKKPYTVRKIYSNEVVVQPSVPTGLHSQASY